MAECRAPSIALEGAEPSGEEQEPLISKVVDERTQFLTQLFDRYRRSLLRYLTDLLSRREDAEDVLQDAYLRLMSVRDLDRSGSRARAYLFRVATNLAYDRFRNRQARGKQAADELSDLPSADPSPERIVVFDQGLAMVKQTLLELKPRCRQVFLLRAAEELSYEDIAGRLGISKRTVEREMRHALDVCQKRLRVQQRP